METTENKSNRRIRHIISIVLALGVVFASPIGLMIFTSFLDYTQLSDTALILITSVITLSLITIPCYFICRYNYKSVWYVPLLVNLGTLLIKGGILSNYWSLNAKYGLVFAALFLAIILSILGSRKGKQIKDRQLL